MSEFAESIRDGGIDLASVAVVSNKVEGLTTPHCG